MTTIGTPTDSASITEAVESAAQISQKDLAGSNGSSPLPCTGYCDRVVSKGQQLLVRTDQGASLTFSKIRHGFVERQRAIAALWDVSLDVRPGEFVSLVGPSGCGKTTLLNMAAGLVRPHTGRVELDGTPVTKPSKFVAYMPARDALLAWRSARKNVELPLEVRGIPRDARKELSREWLSRVGLAEFEDWRPRRLSQGMRQRVSIARTLAMAPRCVLMDEPFAALDAQTRIDLQDEFLDLWDSTRVTVLFVTHDLREAILLADRVVLLSPRPGVILADERVPFTRPRNRAQLEHEDQFHSLLTRLSQMLDSGRRTAG